MNRELALTDMQLKMRKIRALHLRILKAYVLAGSTSLWMDDFRFVRNTKGRMEALVILLSSI